MTLSKGKFIERVVELTKDSQGLKALVPMLESDIDNILEIWQEPIKDDRSLADIDFDRYLAWATTLPDGVKLEESDDKFINDIVRDILSTLTILQLELYSDESPDDDDRKFLSEVVETMKGLTKTSNPRYMLNDEGMVRRLREMFNTTQMEDF